MFYGLVALFTIASSMTTNGPHRFFIDQVRSKNQPFQLKRSIRDSIGHNRMVNTVYRTNKNQILDDNARHQEQKTQQSALMNQYASFFMNHQISGSESKAQLSQAELKKQLKAAYREILRQRRQKLMQMYG